MQYYDIPSSYSIISNPQIVNNQKAGEVYYSAANGVILFYHDAQISGEYKDGTIENTDEIKSAIR